MGKDRDLINIKVCNYCDIIQHSNYLFTKRDTHNVTIEITEIITQY